MKKRFKKIRMPANNENGYTLIIVIMALVVISVLGLGLMGTTASTLKQSDSERTDQSAFYIAESGVVQKREELNKVVENAYHFTKDNFVTDKNKSFEENLNNFKNIFFANVNTEINRRKNSKYVNYEQQLNSDQKPYADVTVVESKVTSNSYEIISTGWIKQKHRTVAQMFTINFKDPDPPNNSISEYAVHVKNGITVKGSANIYPKPISVATESTPSAVNIQDKFSDQVNAKTNQPFPKEPLSTLKNNFNSFSNLPMSDNSTYKCTNNTINKICLNTANIKLNSLNNDGNLIIDTGDDSDKQIFLNQLDNKGNIIINGAKKLTIYVKSLINIGTIKYNNNTNSNLSIYYNGNESNPDNLKLTGNEKIYGKFYAPNTNINLRGNGSVFGSIIANSFDARGNSSVSFTLENQNINVIINNLNPKDSLSIDYQPIQEIDN
ncbi:PilX N-terminal domain-containing pilus assembly protein [Rummeliibacillus pycnus]|uniref:DUF7305 domain-containing protein n=1 Tax=Rummeliibacillus pycnus TaxID=101070 RepID=UPI0037CAC411